MSSGFSDEANLVESSVDTAGSDDSEAVDRAQASAKTQRRDRSRRSSRRKETASRSGRPDRSQESRQWWDFTGRDVPLLRRRTQEGRAVAAIRESCVVLLREVCDLRTSVAGISEYYGDEMAPRVAFVRKSAAESQMHAFTIRLLAPGRLAESAESLAAAANWLAEDTIGGIDLGRGMMIRGPDFANMDASADKFVLTALEQARGTRVRREDHTEALQQASVELLRAVTELRTGVANTHEYRGDRMGMAAQLAAIRTRAADSQVHALNVALLAPESLAQPAQDLARAANRLAEGATRETDLDRGIMARRPDFSEISALGDAFALAAVEQAGSSHARREDHAVALQQASVDLLRAVTELRTAAANIYDYRGHKRDEMAEQLAGIRNLAADSQVHAAKVSFFAPGTLAEPAQALAAAASRFAEAIAANTDFDRVVIIGFLDFHELDASTNGFRQIAVRNARG